MFSMSLYRNVLRYTMNLYAGKGTSDASSSPCSIAQTQRHDSQLPALYTVCK
jgi:hypothetical protein